MFGSIGSANGDRRPERIATHVWTGLGGGQTYEWYVTVSDGTTTTTGPTWTFHTAAERRSGVRRCGRHRRPATSTEDEATAAVIAGIQGTIFTTGDNVYPNGTLQSSPACYDPAVGQPVQVRTRPVPGNHDWGTGARDLDGYIGYFGAAPPTPAARATTATTSAANWHVVNLDSECADGARRLRRRIAQELWLKADLAANSTKNVIALWHKPRFSSGATNLTRVQPLVDDLYAAGVDIVLVGHDHIYERFQPLDPTGAVATRPTGSSTSPSGPAARATTAAGTPLPTSEVLNATTFGILKLTLHATSYDWEFLPVAGQTFTDSRHRGHVAPPRRTGRRSRRLTLHARRRTRPSWWPHPASLRTTPMRPTH